MDLEKELTDLEEHLREEKEALNGMVEENRRANNSDYHYFKGRKHGTDHALHKVTCILNSLKAEKRRAERIK